MRLSASARANAASTRCNFPVKPAPPPRSAARALLFLVAGIYLTGFPYHPGLRSPNELCRLWQTRALVEYGTLDINHVVMESDPDWGPVGDLSRYQGKLYPSKAPLLAFAAIPIYKGLSIFGGGGKNAVTQISLVFWSRLFLTVLPTLAMLWLLRRFLGTYLSSHVADAVTATYALGSLAFSYSLLFMSHQTTAVLLFTSFYALWRCERGEWNLKLGYLVAGACAGAAIAAEYTSALGVIGLLAYGILTHPRTKKGRWKNLVPHLIFATSGALPFIAGLAAYHALAFGNPLHTGYKYLNDAAYQPWHVGGFLGIKTPDPRAFWLSFFSPLRGLFVLSPFLLLTFGGLRTVWKDKDERMRGLWFFTLLLMCLYGYFTSSFSYESWGWTTGPRHLTGLVPFLLLPIGFFLQKLEEKRAELYGIGVGLCVLSILITGFLTGVNYVPDSVTSPVFGFALPLYWRGYLPPTILGGILPNPWAGALWMGALVTAAVLTAGVLTQERTPKKLMYALGTTCAVFLLLLAALPRNVEADRGAVGHLESVWLTPPGKRLSLK
jgi:hypothetical protein